jgi:Condensation domain
VVWCEPVGQLIVMVHHLVVDGVSWRILLPDLARAYAGESLEAVGTSVRTWSRCLGQEAVARAGELELWQGLLGVPVAGGGAGPDLVIGSRALDEGGDLVATVQHVRVSLPASVTGPLLGQVPAALRAGIDEVLLAALAAALGRWNGVAAAGRGGRAGDLPGSVVVDVEGHGRHDVIGGVDLSRTVGWFTTMFPLRLPAGGSGPAGGGGPAAAG